MAQERVTGNLRELNFYGEGKAEDIKRGFAITSLRNPRTDYSFKRGEIILAKCKDDNEDVQVVVISNETKKLNEHPIPVLTMDGFFSADHAAEGMRNGGYPGYENTSPESEMQAIVFVKLAATFGLDDRLQEKLLNEPVDNLLRNQKLRHLFFPTMAFHLSQIGGDVGDWSDFLYIANSLISASEYSFMQHYGKNGRNVFELMKGKPKILKEIAMDPENSFFRPLVLGIDNSPHGIDPKAWFNSQMGYDHK